jgi:ATP-dependent Lon protease
VLLPARNKKELDEIPEEARKQLHFVWTEKIDDALNHAFSDDAALKSQERTRWC